MGIILVLFRKDVRREVIVAFLRNFYGQSRWAQVFQEHDRLYGIEVLAEQIDKQKSILMRFPEVVWCERVNTINFVRDRLV